MGPDDYVTRDEFAVVVRFLIARLQMQADYYASLLAVLTADKVVPDGTIQEIQKMVADSEASRAAKSALASLQESVDIQNLLRKFEDPPQE
jgi:hypothetical protein